MVKLTDTEIWPLNDPKGPNRGGVYLSGEPITMSHFFKKIKNTAKYLKAYPLDIEVFEFGTLDDELLRQAFIDSADIEKHKVALLPIPYDLTVMRVAVRITDEKYGRLPVGVFIICGSGIVLREEVADYDSRYLVILSATNGQIVVYHFVRDFDGTIIEEDNKPTDNRIIAFLEMVTFGCLQIINSPVQRERSPTSHDSKRLAKLRGVHLASGVTTIRSAYLPASARAPRDATGQPGTHASPSEHKRRAHQRHLKSGKVIDVHECVVNKGKKGAPRAYYKVKSDEN